MKFQMSFQMLVRQLPAGLLYDQCRSYYNFLVDLDAPLETPLIEEAKAILSSLRVDNMKQNIFELAQKFIGTLPGDGKIGFLI